MVPLFQRLLIFLAFGLIISPAQGWADYAFGSLTGDEVIKWNTFNAGGLYFYGIVLCSDALFQLATNKLDEVIWEIAEQTAVFLRQLLALASLILIVGCLITALAFETKHANPDEAGRVIQIVVAALALFVNCVVYFQVAAPKQSAAGAL